MQNDPVSGRGRHVTLQMATTPLEVHCNLHYQPRILSLREYSFLICMSQLLNIKSFWDKRLGAVKKKLPSFNEKSAVGSQEQQ